MAKKLNINDIAKLTGVSRSTVSRVLMDSKKVSRETAEKVKKAMREHNYHPNFMARGLVTGSANMVAMLMMEVENPLFLHMVGTLEQEFRNRGYILSICYLGQTKESRLENFRNIQQYGFSGFVIGDSQNDPSFVKIMKSLSQPLVIFNRYLEELNEFDSILVNHYQGGYIAAKHLIELGHRDIGFLTGPIKDSSASRDRYRGFRDAMEEHGVPMRQELIREGRLDFDSGSEYAKLILKERKAKCTAVFASNDAMAIGILNYCREYGISVPNQVSLMGFDDITLAQSSLVNLTTIKQPYIEMCSLIADHLDARIKGIDHAPHRVVLEPTLVVRGTTKRLAR